METEVSMEKGVEMRFRIFLTAILLFATIGFAGAAEKEISHDAAYQKAREQMADLLASEDCQKIEVSASSFDRAMDWVYRAVDTYLEKAAPGLGGSERAGEYGVELLRGLNEHRVRYAEEDGHDLVGDRNLLVSSEEDAVDLGELLARVAEIVDEAHVGRGVNIQSAAKKVFESLAPTAGANQGLITQYLVELRAMSREERESLTRHLRDS